MKTRSKYYFSMIELVLAIGVAVIGMLCVLALMPVGLNAGRDAVADNYLPDMANMMISYIRIQSDIDSDFAENVLPAAKPSANDSEGYFYPDEGTWGDSIFGGSKNNAGGLVLATDEDGEYLVVQQVIIDGVTVPEFTGVMKVWRDNSSTLLSEDLVSGASPLVNADGDEYYKYVPVVVEVSWPAEFPYQRRVELGNTRTYSLEIFTDNGVLLP